MSNKFKQSESERYFKQLIRINQMGISVIVLLLLQLPYINLYGLNLYIEICVGLLITLNILAFIYSAFGIDIGRVGQKLLRENF